MNEASTDKNARELIQSDCRGLMIFYLRFQTVGDEYTVSLKEIFDVYISINTAALDSITYYSNKPHF